MYDACTFHALSATHMYVQAIVMNGACIQVSCMGLSKIDMMMFLIMPMSLQLLSMATFLMLMFLIYYLTTFILFHAVATSHWHISSYSLLLPLHQQPQQLGNGTNCLIIITILKFILSSIMDKELQNLLTHNFILVVPRLAQNSH